MLLAAQALCRHYRRAGHVVRAVDAVDLAVARGEFLAIVGASGSGKSTLLNLLAGLDTPTAGSVRVDGRALDALSPRERAAYRARRVGMVFQAFNLLPHLTALQNVALALCFGAEPPAGRRARAAAVLERVGLGERMDHRPLDLSGGEQQRVALARALVKGPELLFADEPTGNLDAKSAAAIAALLADSHWQGLTIVLVTHDLALARHAAGRLVRMHYGRVVDGEANDPPPRAPAAGGAP